MRAHGEARIRSDFKDLYTYLQISTFLSSFAPILMLNIFWFLVEIYSVLAHNPAHLLYRTLHHCMIIVRQSSVTVFAKLRYTSLDFKCRRKDVIMLFLKNV